MRSTGTVLVEKPSIGIEPTRLFDASRNKNHGVHTNITMVQLPSGLWVRSFNGSTSKVIATLLSEITKAGTYTFCAWMKIDDPDAGSQTVFENVLSASDRNSLNVYSNEVRFGYYNGAAYIGKSGTLTTDWTFVVGRNDGGTVYLALNSVNQTGTNLDTIDFTVAGFRLGLSGNDGRAYGGLIALPKVSNYILSAGQIKRIFENQRHWFGV